MTHRLSPLLRSQSGLTVLETAAVVFIVSIIVVPLLAIGSQFLILPVEWRANVTAMRDAREAVKWVADDARQAMSFTPELDQPDYGKFEWIDYTVTPFQKFSVRYFYEADTDSLWREETVDSITTKRVVIDSVAEYTDFQMLERAGVVKATVTTTVESIRVEHQRTHEIAAKRRPLFPGLNYLLP